jgi:RNA polymerase sigma-70 factor, ECF subfamily
MGPAALAARGQTCGVNGFRHGVLMTGNSSETNQLLEQAAQGDPQGLGTLLARHGDRLRRMVALRLDRRLQGRIDPSDVIQEAYLEASVRLAE